MECLQGEPQPARRGSLHELSDMRRMVRSRMSLCSSGRRGQRVLIEAQELEQRLQVAHLLAGGRGGAADEVEDLAVLEAVIGEPADLAVLVEIDRDHALVDDLL